MIRHRLPDEPLPAHLRQAQHAGLHERGHALALTCFGGGKSSQSSATTATNTNTQTGASDQAIIGDRNQVDHSTNTNIDASSRTNIQANDNSANWTDNSTTIDASDNSQNWNDESFNYTDNSVSNDMSPEAIQAAYASLNRLGGRAFDSVDNLAALNAGTFALSLDAANLMAEGGFELASDLGGDAMALSRAIIGDNTALTRQLAGQASAVADNALAGARNMISTQQNQGRGLDQKTILIIAGIAVAALFALRK